MQPKDKSQEQPQEDSVLDLRELVLRAKKGDATIMPQLKEYVRQHPEVWNRVGDVSLQSQAAWTRLLSGRDKHLQECIVAKVNAMKIELSDGESSPLENLLVERVISTWLELYYHETRSAQGEEKSLRWAEFRLKQLSAASDRHMKAIGALATLKKLLPSRSAAPAVPQPTAASNPCVPRNGHAPNAGELVDEPERVNGHVNGHSANRVAALLNGKAVSAEG